MKQKSWWAYIPDVCEEGVVIDADTFEEAIPLAQEALLLTEWNTQLRYSVMRDVGFYMYELGPLHFCNFTEEEEE
tara:strand:- start:915 stop:1139 length:225 start_codon:yes stop_codon:yes gene_type:complete